MVGRGSSKDRPSQYKSHLPACPACGAMGTNEVKKCSVIFRDLENFAKNCFSENKSLGTS